jgi:hypothetical protein
MCCECAGVRVLMCELLWEIAVPSDNLHSTRVQNPHKKWRTLKTEDKVKILFRFLVFRRPITLKFAQYQWLSVEFFSIDGAFSTALADIVVEMDIRCLLKGVDLVRVLTYLQWWLHKSLHPKNRVFWATTLDSGEIRTSNHQSIPIDQKYSLSGWTEPVNKMQSISNFQNLSLRGRNLQLIRVAFAGNFAHGRAKYRRLVFLFQIPRFFAFSCAVEQNAVNFQSVGVAFLRNS